MSDTTDEEIKSFYATIGVETEVIDTATRATELPFKLVPELAVSTSSSFDIVSVIDNKDTVRISWETLTANHVTQTSSIPQGPGLADDPYLTFAADDSGLYFSDGVQWRKTPVYNANWDDLTDDTRFLLVNAPMSLTETEVSNVWQSINLAEATTESLGVVKGSETVGVEADGTLYVNRAIPATIVLPDSVPGIVKVKDYYDASDIDLADTHVVTENYVREALNTYSETNPLPIATYQSLGIVQLTSGSPLKVDEAGLLTISSANYNTEGVVRLALKTDTERLTDTQAASVGLVRDLIYNETVTFNSRIAGTELGMVRVPGDTAITIGGTGVIDVKTANASTSGIVKMQQVLDPAVEYSNATTGSHAVTPEAVTKYVTNRIENIAENLSPATADKLGAVMIGDGIHVDETGLIKMMNATEESIGGVLIEPATVDTAQFTVPTIAKVLELLGDVTESGKKATSASYGVVKLGTASIITDGTPVGVNTNGQLCVPINIPAIIGEDGSFDMELATYTSKGSVYLSSPHENLSETVLVHAGLPIGRDINGAIYVDATNDSSKATSSRPGLVKLSVSTDEVLPETNPGIGIDSRGRIRVQSGTIDSTGTYYFYDIAKTEAAARGYTNLNSYTDGNYTYPIILDATYDTGGAVMLGSEDIVVNGIPVGVDAYGRLSAALNVTSEDGIITIQTATSTTEGLVKLGVDTTITSGGLPVGINADGQLTVASTSTAISLATTTALGGVMLSTDTRYTADASSVVGVNSSNQLVVPKAGNSTYGTVKVGGDTYTNDNCTLVGLDSSGRLAVSGISSSPAAGGPFHVTLAQVGINPLTRAVIYRVTMTGGIVQLNDGSLLNVEDITDEDDLQIEPAEGQVLRLQVYTSSLGDPVAKLTLTDSTNVLTCKPVLG